MFARFNAEAEYRAMVHTTCELMWIQSFLSKIGELYNKLMVMGCDNQVVMYVANNLIFMSELSILKSTFILSETW